MNRPQRDLHEYLSETSQHAEVRPGTTAVPGTRWHRAVDTSREAPHDLYAAGDEPLCEVSQTYRLSPRSSAILLSWP